MQAPFVINPSMVAVAVAYKNKILIADKVLPRVPTDGQKFTYLKYALGEFTTIPETKVGRKGKPNEVEFSSTEVPGLTVDHGLDAPVPQADILNWQAAVAAGNTALADPRLRATTGLTELIALAREVRTAGVVFDAANYGANNQDTLVGNGQWSDYVNSNPEADIFDALDSMVMRPTDVVFGQRTWSVLSRHPKLVKSILGANTERGVLKRAEFMEHFELPGEMHVGQGWLNTAKPGQPVQNARVWGNHASFYYQNMNADTQYGTTFGFTAEWGGRVAGTIQDQDMGIRGGERARVGESVLELITAPDLGYLFRNAVAAA